MNIPEKTDKIKTWASSNTGQTVLIVLVIIVSNIVSFKLGQSSITPNKTNANNLQFKNQEISHKLNDEDLPEGSLAAAVYKSQNNTTDREESIAQNGTLGFGIDAPPRYVASNNGRVYYFTWCTGAKRIIEENRRYFNSAQDARAAGLTPSTACPDLD